MHIPTSQLLSTESGQMTRVALADKSSALSAVDDSAPAHAKSKTQIFLHCPPSLSLNRNIYTN